jgi:hypothetical protein
MILRKRSYATLLIILIFIGFSIIPTVSAGPVVTNGIASESLTGKLITMPTDMVPFQVPTWYLMNTALTAKSDPLPYSNDARACGFGYCNSDSFIRNNSESGVIPVNITPYYPPKFWNYPPPGFMPLVPHTNPAMYYSEASSAAGITNGFDNKTGFLFT